MFIRQLTLRNELDDLRNQPPEIGFVLVNSGGSDATILESNVTIRFDPSRNVPRFTDQSMAIPYEFGDSNKLGFDCLESGFSRLVVKRGRPIENDQQASAFFSRNLFLYVLGFIGYTDKLGRHYQTAFCRRFSFDERRFVPTNNPDYEYED